MRNNSHTCNVIQINVTATVPSRNKNVPISDGGKDMENNVKNNVVM